MRSMTYGTFPVEVESAVIGEGCCRRFLRHLAERWLSRWFRPRIEGAFWCRTYPDGDVAIAPYDSGRFGKFGKGPVQVGRFEVMVVPKEEA